MDAPLKAREATAQDIDQLARLRWQFREEFRLTDGASFEPFAAEFAAVLGEGFAAGSWRVWVAEEAGRIVANVYLQVVRKLPSPTSPRGRFGYITSVYAVPEYRNRGTGNALLNVAIGWAKAHGLEFAVLWPSERSVPLYTRLGFRPATDAMQLDFMEMEMPVSTPPTPK